MTTSELLRATTRPLRRARRVLATSDPDRSRLRLAVTTISTLVVVAAVLFVGAIVAGQVVTAVIPGIILAMISSMAVREPRPAPRAATILLLVPASLASISLASVLSGVPLLADAVFVAVAVVAVYLRALGPRGMALGMLAFMSYFLAIFIKIAPAQLPVVAAALLISAGITIGMRLVFRTRRPDRDLQRMLAALGDRAGRVVDALNEGVVEGELDERLERTIRSRVAASSSTASSVEDVLDTAEQAVVQGIANDELGVRVFDFQLIIEHLVEAVGRLLGAGEMPPAGRAVLSTSLGRLAGTLRGSVRLRRQDVGSGDTKQAPPSADGPSQGLSSPGPSSPGPSPVRSTQADRLARLDRIVTLATAAWTSVASRGADASTEASPELTDPFGLDVGENPSDDPAGAEPSTESDAPAEKESEEADRRTMILTLTRQAVQVAVAAALAIAAGTAISSSRWFWAVIAAFVVYVGTSSRGEILTKGWLRVVGTLGGVVVGVLIAALVGGNTVVAIVLIAACLFAGVYLMQLSSAFMIFFITTMLALLYGLLGEFSIGLLLTRLAETAAGAAIGVGVAYVVLPTRTRDVSRDRVRDFLDALAGAVDSSAEKLTAETASGSSGPAIVAASPGSGRDLRSAFDALRIAVKPLTQGIAGISDRSGSRRTMQILGACEHHGRALLRLADGAPAVADTETLRRTLRDAADTVRGNVEAMRGALSGGFGGVTMRSAEAALDEFDGLPAVAASAHRNELIAASRNLRAIDRAVCTRAEELGASAAVVAPDLSRAV